MLYLIGLGLNEKGISLEGLEALKKFKEKDKIYLESYTVDFPYSIGKINKILNKEIIKLKREDVESEKLIKESKNKNIGLLIYGSPLSATTHLSLINDCVKQGIKYKIIHSASVFDAIAESGLQPYKFGRTTSIPEWQEKENYKPESFIDVVKENEKINAHTLLLVNPGLSFEKALMQLETAARGKIKIDKIIVCSQLGTDNKKIVYDNINNLKKLASRIKHPFCIIIPGKLHFVEEEVLKRLEKA